MWKQGEVFDVYEDGILLFDGNRYHLDEAGDCSMKFLE